MSIPNIAAQPDHSAIAGIQRTARWRELIDQELKAIPQRILNETGGQVRLKYNEQVKEFLLDQIAKSGYRRSAVKLVIERHLFRPLLRLIFTGQIKEGDVLLVEVSEDGKRLYFNCPQASQSQRSQLL